MNTTIPCYKNLDKELIMKFWNILRKMERGIPKGRDIYNGRCAKEIFVRRTLHKWFSGHHIVAVIKEDTGIVTFDKDDRTGSSAKHLKIPVKNYVHINAVTYVLGWGEEIEIRYSKTGSVTLSSSMRFHGHGDMCSVDFYEIDKAKYDEVWNLFLDDRPQKEYRMLAFHKGTIKDTIVTVMGRDYDEARENAIKENPDYVIDGRLEEDWLKVKDALKREKERKRERKKSNSSN